MVGRLVQLVQDANLSSSLRCSSKHSIAELIFRNHLRATEGKKDAALLNTLQALYVQAGIAPSTHCAKPHGAWQKQEDQEQSDHTAGHVHQDT